MDFFQPLSLEGWKFCHIVDANLSLIRLKHKKKNYEKVLVKINEVNEEEKQEEVEENKTEIHYYEM